MNLAKVTLFDKFIHQTFKNTPNILKIFYELYIEINADISKLNDELNTYANSINI